MWPVRCMTWGRQQLRLAHSKAVASMLQVLCCPTQPPFSCVLQVCPSSRLTQGPILAYIRLPEHACSDRPRTSHPIPWNWNSANNPSTPPFLPPFGRARLCLTSYLAPLASAAANVLHTCIIHLNCLASSSRHRARLLADPIVSISRYLAQLEFDADPDYDFLRK